MKLKSYLGFNKFSIVAIFSTMSFWFKTIKFLSAFMFISNLFNAIASFVNGSDIEAKKSWLNSWLKFAMI